MFFNKRLFKQLNAPTPVRNYITNTFKNGIQTISMCDKKTRNSLSIPMMEHLIQSIDSLASNRACRSIVLTAEPGAIFSAGHNLKELADPARQPHVFALAARLMRTLIDSPLPVIARIDGLAAAAGCQLAAQCDLVFCTERSAFSTPGAAVGVFCSTPGVALARAASRKRAMQMLLTGAPISSREAYECGLANGVCASLEQLDAEIGAVCGAIGAKGRDVIALGKKFFYEQVDLGVREAYEVGGRKMVENLRIDDGKEGITSFIEKRKPEWKP